MMIFLEKRLPLHSDILQHDQNQVSHNDVVFSFLEKLFHKAS